MSDEHSPLSFILKLTISIILVVIFTLPSCLEKKLHKMELEKIQKKVDHLAEEVQCHKKDRKMNPPDVLQPVPSSDIPATVPED